MAYSNGTVSTALVPCLRFFKNLLALLKESSFATTEAPLIRWDDELSRLRAWAASIGALQTGQASLDFRLRDASHISKMIIKLLDGLETTIEDVKVVLNEGNAAGNNLAMHPSAEDDSTTELQELHEQISTIISELFESRLDNVKAFEPFDREHVRNKLPAADRDIIQRLGYAITRRRGYLRYRERHHAKLGKGLSDIRDQSEMSETTATEFDFEETNSNSGISETSSSPSLVDGGNFTIPQPPSESTNGKPFECPYCFFVITISGTRSWTKHILKDLQPYICTFPHCSRPDKLYDSRREWFDHITKVHLQGFDRHSTDRKPICPLCKDSMTSGKQLERHLARHLEELALFALPPNKSTNDENDFNSSHALENDPREVVPPASPKRKELDELEEQDAHHESASKGDHLRDEIDVYQETLDGISSDGVAQDVFDNLSDVTYVAQDELRSPPSARPSLASNTTREDLDGDAFLNDNSDAGFPGPSGANPPNQTPERANTGRSHGGGKSTPYHCLHPTCRRQFARCYDLSRHARTHFPENLPRYDCPEKWCGRTGKDGFTRKDHLTEHRRNMHMKGISKWLRLIGGSR